jgi:hypothetical protein
MMPTPLWIGSFVYLAFVSAFVCTAVKESDDRQLWLKTLTFFAMIVGGTLAFCGVILAIERLL